MALSNGPQAHDEPRLTRTEPRLIRGRDHRRVAERGGLDGVLVGEIRADEKPSLL